MTNQHQRVAKRSASSPPGMHKSSCTGFTAATKALQDRLLSIRSWLTATMVSAPTMAHRQHTSQACGQWFPRAHNIANAPILIDAHFFNISSRMLRNPNGAFLPPTAGDMNPHTGRQLMPDCAVKYPSAPLTIPTWRCRLVLIGLSIVSGSKNKVAKIILDTEATKNANISISFD